MVFLFEKKEKMRDFPSCFGENGVQVADASCTNAGGTKSPQNSITCVYKCKLLGKSCLISIIWSKNLMGQCLSVEIDDASNQCLCKVDVKPSLFSKRKGSKIVELNSSYKLELFWDLSMAKFGSGSEPLEGYYIAIVLKGNMVLLVGDLRKEAFKKTGGIASISSHNFISKREHIVGKRVFSTKAQFCGDGQVHDLKIECSCDNDDPALVVRVDAKTVMQVKHLQWKFRGNYTILVDGLPVEVFWDVYNWLFGSLGNAVFMFRTCLSAEKMWGSSSTSCDFDWSCSEKLRRDDLSGHGFSLLLYAWKNE